MSRRNHARDRGPRLELPIEAPERRPSTTTDPQTRDEPATTIEIDLVVTEDDNIVRSPRRDRQDHEGGESPERGRSTVIEISLV